MVFGPIKTEHGDLQVENGIKGAVCMYGMMQPSIHLVLHLYIRDYESSI